MIDPFADDGDALGDSNVGSQQDYIHIRVQQRNGRKTLTTLQGLPKGVLILYVLSTSRLMAVHSVTFRIRP